MRRAVVTVTLATILGALLAPEAQAATTVSCVTGGTFVLNRPWVVVESPPSRRPKRTVAKLFSNAYNCGLPPETDPGQPGPHLVVKLTFPSHRIREAVHADSIQAKVRVSGSRAIKARMAKTTITGALPPAGGPSQALVIDIQGVFTHGTVLVGRPFQLRYVTNLVVPDVYENQTDEVRGFNANSGESRFVYETE
jgi:hypothetical protein